MTGRRRRRAPGVSRALGRPDRPPVEECHRGACRGEEERDAIGRRRHPRRQGDGGQRHEEAQSGQPRPSAAARRGGPRGEIRHPDEQHAHGTGQEHRPWTRRHRSRPRQPPGRDHSAKDERHEPGQQCPRGRDRGDETVQCRRGRRRGPPRRGRHGSRFEGGGFQILSARSLPTSAAEGSVSSRPRRPWRPGPDPSPGRSSPTGNRRGRSGRRRRSSGRWAAAGRGSR